MKYRYAYYDLKYLFFQINKMQEIIFNIITWNTYYPTSHDLYNH